MLVDSTIFIQFFRGQKQALEFFQSQKNLATSVLVIMEVLFGARSKREQQQVLATLDQFSIKLIHLNSSISQIAFKILLKNRLKTGIGVADALIAATAVKYNLVLATHNVKHYQKVKNLKSKLPY